ncbi:MAG: radical SAM protein [Syntrophomonadaceae bacterium]|nr:radical SAM protein [Syntrophomonadaceae bacterium]
MKITMIEPKAPGKHVFSAVKMPRLGLPLLGTLLKQSGHEVELILGSREDIRLSSIINSDLVCVSTTTSTVIEAYHLADFARSQGIPVMMGGAHVSFMPDEALQHCDYVNRGEADSTFIQLVDCIEQGELPWQVPGVSFFDGEKVVHNPPPEWIDVNQSPIPDLSLFVNLKMSTYPVMTSRGCPFDCTFCSVTSMFGRKHRCRSVELVLEELEQYKGKQVFFIDDNFTANPRRSKELLTEMIRRDILPSWWCAQVRSDAARDNELLRLMRKANCGMVFVGMESINPKTLASYNKKQDVEDITWCIQNFHHHRIMVHGMFVFGADDDTLETINETVDFAIKHRIDSVQFLVLTPLPGTRTFDELLESGRLLTRDWNFYDAHHVVFEPRLMSASDLQKAALQGFKKFYSLRNITGNLFLTGVRSAAFRALGFWVSRRWEKENRWYYSFLDSLTNPVQLAPVRGSISKTIEAYKVHWLKYRTREQLMEIKITRQEGSFLVDLKGCVNGFSLQETLNTLSAQLPRFYQNITINIEQVNFSSERLVVDFVRGLNNLTNRARKVHLQISASNSYLLEVLKKYNLTIPVFSISG